MATIEIDKVDWFDYDWYFELTDREAQTLQGGRLPNDGGRGSGRAPQPPLFITALPGPTIPIGPTLRLPLGKPTFP